MSSWFKTAAAVLSLILIVTTPAGAAQEFRHRLSTNIAKSVESLQSDVEAEVEFGRELAGVILGRYAMVEDSAIHRYVNLVGQAVALNAQRQELNYRFAVIKDDEINAYTAPGGYIFITSGALAAMEDEAELAGVIAHELSHVTQRHIVKELKIEGQESSAQAGLAHILGGSSDPTRVAFNQALNKAYSVLFEEGMKQADEYEADQMGTLLLASTGYDPTALRRYLQRVSTMNRKSLEALKKTHPPLTSRIRALDELIRSEGLDSLFAPRVTARFERTLNRK